MQSCSKPTKKINFLGSRQIRKASFNYFCAKSRIKLTSILIPTLYLPPIEAVAIIKVSEMVIVDVHETYPRQTCRNRCRIGAANGILDMTIPVEKPNGNSTPTGKVVPSTRLPWQKQHWKSICAAYGKSAFFMHYLHLMEPFYLGSAPETLVQWNQDLQEALFEELNIDTEIAIASTFEKEVNGMLDLRSEISPKLKKLDSEKNLIFKPYFQPFSHKYGFLPNLSIIDALFNLGPDTPEYLDECGKKLINYYLEKHRENYRF